MQRESAALVFSRALAEVGSAVMQVVHVAPIHITSPADDRGPKPAAKLRRDIHETRACRASKPLVSVNGKHVHRCFLNMKTQGADTLRAIQEQRNPASAQERRDLG